MNILFLTSTLPRFAGDSQAPFVLEQAQAWKNARPDDTIIILAPGDSDASRNETWNGIAVNRFTYFYPRHFQKLAYPAILPNIKRNPLLIFQIPFFLFSQFWVARRLCKKYNITLVYAHWVMPQGITAYLLHGLLRIPYILQNHSSDLSIFRKIPIFGKSMARAIINKATRLFCVNCILKDEALLFIQEKERGETEKKITILPIGFSLASNAPTENKQYDFGMIARLSRKKGIDLFFRALQRVQEKYPDLRTAIAGDGEERAALETLAGHLNLKIDFIGFVHGEAKAAFINQTRVFVFPSVQIQNDREGLPVAILEALSCGKKIIASSATHIDLFADWPQIQQSVDIIEDPTAIDRFSECLDRSLHQKNIAANATREILKKYHWGILILDYLNAIGLPQPTITKSTGL